MAEGKNTIVFYRDWKEIFESLSDKDCAELIRHIFRYVNDENPETDNEIVKYVFIPIKNSLKRDLKKWENIRQKRSDAGKASAESRKQSEQMSTSVESDQQTSTNPTVSDSVTVIDSDKRKKTINQKIKEREKKEELFKKEVLEFKDQYDHNMLKAFFNYWSEPTKDKTKMRFEQEKTWDVKRRLITWYNRSKK